MSQILTIDIGAGTMDILYYNTQSGLHYKSVVKSPVAHIAERADQIEGKILIVGKEMGGGAVSQVLKKKAQKTDVVMSVSAAATVHHNLARVRSFGIKVVEDQMRDSRHEAH